MAGLLSDFVSERESQEPFLQLDDGYSIGMPDEEDSVGTELVPARNSTQAAMQIADQHEQAWSSLKDPSQPWSGASRNMRTITPSQRFNISTGLIDARAPMADVHSGLNYTDRGAQGHGQAPAFTGQSVWDNQFTPQIQIPKSTHGFRTDPTSTVTPGSPAFTSAAAATVGQTGLSGGSGKELAPAPTYKGINGNTIIDDQKYGSAYTDSPHQFSSPI